MQPNKPSQETGEKLNGMDKYPIMSFLCARIFKSYSKGGASLTPELRIRKQERRSLQRVLAPPYDDRTAKTVSHSSAADAIAPLMSTGHPIQPRLPCAKVATLGARD